MTKVTARREAVLAAIPYFRGLSAGDLRRLAAHAIVRDVRRGARVFDEGAPAEGLFVVMEGRVRLVRISRGGREQVLHSEGPGATLGEVPLLDGGGLTARTAGLLLAEAGTAGGTAFELSATREELAARLGTVRELVSRALARLRKAGVIRVAGRRVTILDARGLADLAEGR